MLLLALNVVALGAVVWLWLRMSFFSLYVHGAYSDLESRGVIDHGALGEFVGERLASDWMHFVHEYLMGGELWDRAFVMIYVVGGLVLASVVVCLVGIALASRAAPAGEEEQGG